MTIAFGIRNVPRIDAALAEAFRVLKIGGRFLCLEFSAVDVPGLDRLYDFYSFNVIPALGRAVAGDAESYRYLVESIRRFPEARRLRRHDARGGLRPRFVSADDRRHRRAAFRLAFVISAPAHLVRLGRAGFVFAREGVFGLVDPAAVPVPARPLLRLARLFERPHERRRRTRLSAALTRLGPSYVKLGQFLATRPTSSARRWPAISNGCRTRCRRSRKRSRSGDRRLVRQAVRSLFASFGPPVAAASIAQVHRADGRDGGRAARRRGQGAAARHRAALPRRPRRLHFRRPARRRSFRRGAAAAAGRGGRHVAALGRGRDGLPPRSRGAFGDGREHQGRSGFRVPAVDWNRTTKEVLTWNGSTPRRCRIARAAAKGFDLPQLGRALIQTFLRHALRDGFFHADMHPGNLFVDDNGRLVAVDFGIMGRLGLKERRFLAEILHGFITRDYHRTAEVHFEAGYVPPHHRSRISRRRSAPSASRSRPGRRRNFDGRAADLLFAFTGLFDMRTRPELLLLQKTMVMVEGVARASIPSSTCGAPPSPWCANG